MSQLTWHRIMISVIGVLSIVTTLLICFPTSWLAMIVASRTEGRWVLGDVEGSLWHGSARIGSMPRGQTVAQVFLPGRLSWQVSPLGILGWVDVRLDNPDVLTHPVHIKGNWRSWNLEEAQWHIPAERLVDLGAPFNTIQPAGQMILSWPVLNLRASKGAIEVTGSMMLEVRNLSSRLSPIRPLGSYQWTVNWHGKQAQCVLKTLAGPLQLSGTGQWENQRMTFSGQAEPDTGSEKQLENLLNLLGQRRTEGNKNIVVLAWK